MTAAGDRGPSSRRQREVDGIVLLDKPAGLSSNHALQRVRRLLEAAKAGHAGTLDPMATGMLPLCFGQATKACGALLGARKAYRVHLQLGRATDTGDALGQVTAEAPVPPFTSSTVEQLFAGHVGSHEQLPPMYSALKHAGRRLYELARRGETVTRSPRRVEIGRLTLLGIEGEEIEFNVECSKGTYVRVLGEDLAAGLGTVGHLVALRRLWIEPFEHADMTRLEQIEAWAAGAGSGERPAWLLAVDSALVELPRLDLDESRSADVRHGRAVPITPAIPSGSRIRAYDIDGRLLGLLVAGPDGVARVTRLFVPGHGTSDGLSDLSDKR